MSKYSLKSYLLTEMLDPEQENLIPIIVNNDLQSVEKGIEQAEGIGMLINVTHSQDGSKLRWDFKVTKVLQSALANEYYDLLNRPGPMPAPINLKLDHSQRPDRQGLVDLAIVYTV